MLPSSIVDEWKAEAKLEARRENLLRVLQFRFPSPIPADVQEAIQAQSDQETLSRWFDAALGATSLEEFGAVVGQADGRSG